LIWLLVSNFVLCCVYFVLCRTKAGKKPSCCVSCSTFTFSSFTEWQDRVIPCLCFSSILISLHLLICLHLSLIFLISLSLILFLLFSSLLFLFPLFFSLCYNFDFSVIISYEYLVFERWFYYDNNRVCCFGFVASCFGRFENRVVLVVENEVCIGFCGRFTVNKRNICNLYLLAYFACYRYLHEKSVIHRDL
jgi:hypothetical protein